ncbi:conserved hypothetical protein [Talaromyces marneffei ATCC 18224]|uniref:Uncharacterized protein n=1 Tax=Talaromyces marneffei (strain ATCC 18224 / CBS 334.59 / QM 7333) TaxID=441960 RepID=B6Q6T4_TALMQ|nr:conserved hypothetical protein [Talaromyces marneffei ATCC 18224]
MPGPAVPPRTGPDTTPQSPIAPQILTAVTHRRYGQRCRPDTSLIDPPTYSRRKFPRQTQTWRFYPRGHPLYYGKCQFTYKAIRLFPYKTSAQVSPKK